MHEILAAMCGRYHLSSPGETMAEVFDLEEVPEEVARYNIGPSQDAPILLDQDGGRALVNAVWGFEGRGGGADSRGAADRSVGNRGHLLINARSETVDRLPSFRDDFKSRRCLVPATGFYEWERHAGQRLPYHLGLRSSPILAMAGLWQRTPTGEHRFVIITTTANDRVAPIHDRMPVIVDRGNHAEWLSEGSSAESLKRFLGPLPSSEMAIWQVSSWVNNIRHEGPRCSERVADAPRQQRLF